MIWEGGIKVIEKNHQQHIRFVSQDGKEFANLTVKILNNINNNI